MLLVRRINRRVRFVEDLLALGGVGISHGEHHAPEADGSNGVIRPQRSGNEA
jgi:hypothetical protein